MKIYIYRHVKASRCPIAITIKTDDVDAHYPMLKEKLEQAKELGIDLPTIDNYELVYENNE